LKFDVIVKHWGFDLAMLLIILFNSVIMIWLMTEPEDPTNTTLNKIDDYMLYIYIAEFVVKVIGLGVIDYYSDPWNIFDFTLIIISLMTDILLTSLDFASNARTARFLRFSRLQKTLRLTKTVKGFRIFKFCLGIISSFYRIKQLIEIIIMSLPAIWRTLSLILIVFYTYSIIGNELFRENALIRTDIQPYGVGTFFSFEDGLLELTHVMIANGWSDLMYNYCQRFEKSLQAQIFFISFHALINIVLRSLLSGLVWDVFSFFDKNNAQQNNDKRSANDVNTENLAKNLNNNNFFKLRYEGSVALMAINESEMTEEEIEEEKHGVGAVNMVDIDNERQVEGKKEDDGGKQSPPKSRFGRKEVAPNKQNSFEDNDDKDKEEESDPKVSKQGADPQLDLKYYKKRGSMANPTTTEEKPSPITSKFNLLEKFKLGPKVAALLQKVVDRGNKKSEVVENPVNVQPDPEIQAPPRINNKLAGLDLDFNLEKKTVQSKDNSMIVNPHIHEQVNVEELSGESLFVDSQGDAAEFSEGEEVGAFPLPVQPPSSISGVLVLQEKGSFPLGGVQKFPAQQVVSPPIQKKRDSSDSPKPSSKRLSAVGGNLIKPVPARHKLAPITSGAIGLVQEKEEEDSENKRDNSDPSEVMDPALIDSSEGRSRPSSRRVIISKGNGTGNLSPNQKGSGLPTAKEPLQLPNLDDSFAERDPKASKVSPFKLQKEKQASQASNDANALNHKSSFKSPNKLTTPASNDPPRRSSLTNGYRGGGNILPIGESAPLEDKIDRNGFMSPQKRILFQSSEFQSNTTSKKNFDKKHMSAMFTTNVVKVS
jgi:voltage-gated sodium channel